VKKTLTYTKTERYRDGLTVEQVAQFADDAELVGISAYRAVVVTVKPIREGGKTGHIVKLEASVES
jgi:hypothetical protein